MTLTQVCAWEENKWFSSHGKHFHCMMDSCLMELPELSKLRNSHWMDHPWITLESWSLILSFFFIHRLFCQHLLNTYCVLETVLVAEAMEPKSLLLLKLDEWRISSQCEGHVWTETIKSEYKLCRESQRTSSLTVFQCEENTLCQKDDWHCVRV